MFPILFFLVLFFQNAHAYLVYGDEDYYIYHTPKFSYILTESDFKYLPKLVSESHKMAALYENEFSWMLDEHTSLISTSNRNQIANAFATISPNNMVVFYKGGVEFLDPSAVSSWIDTLSSHEIAHVYQLNVKSRTGQFLKNIFGNSTYVIIPFIPLPLFTSPTALLPTFILEGNAVLNESRLNRGGRLFSAESLVLATELIEGGSGELRFLMNNYVGFPYGKEKYILGGYFQSYLANRYSFKTTNRFFLKHAENNINPFELKSSFAATFFADYENLYQDFLKNFRTKQKDYNPYRGESLVTSRQSVEFNRINDVIYFLSSPDDKSPKKLNQFKIQHNELHSDNSYLNAGKVFQIDGKFYTASVYSDNNRNIFYSLVDKNYNFLPEFENKYVTDVVGTSVAYFDMTQSYDRGVLYRNQERINETESKALLDPQGNIYYFRQEGSSKILFRNREKIFSLKTNFSLLADVIADNEIYFISNTKNGSGLYCYCDKTIRRVLPYDNIIAAKKAGNGFLVSFLSKDQYLVSHIQAQIKDESPTPPHDIFPSTYFHDVEATAHPEAQESRRYLSLRELRFSQYNINYFSSKKHHTLVNSLSWVDPLLYSSVDMAFSISDDLAYNSLKFLYLPYSTKLGLLLKNETDLYWNETLKLTTNTLQVGVSNTVYAQRFASLSIGADFQTEQNRLFNNEIKSLYMIYRYSESYLLNYLPYLSFSFMPSLEESSGKVSQSFSATGSKMLLTDFYLSLGYTKNNAEYFKLEAKPTPSLFFKRGIATPLYYSTFYSSELTQSEVQLTYEIPYSKYYYRFPFSLRRLAPFVSYQMHDSKEVFYGTEIDRLSFTTIGLEAEILVLHTSPMRVKLLSTDVVIEKKKDNFFGLNLETYF
ncbi:MAG: hypothetical protein JNL11_04910 [Bdellovibrionaceae bacterium]|nr:hypothetical protein [Pseudobdellovibrionaceae bacterium]